MLRVTMNGDSLEFAEGTTILSAARSVGIAIPTLCHDERIKPTGACRLCSVEIVGQSRLVASCTTPVSNGMVVQTHSPRVEESRKTILSLLAQSYPAIESPPPGSELAKAFEQYGVKPSGASGRAFEDTNHPYLKVDMDKCIACYRCVRICEEVQGQFVWRVWNRGDKVEIRPDKGQDLLSSSCVSCGACADTCPSGAIQDRLVVEKGSPTEWTRTTCPYCGTGCEMEIGTRQGQVVVARPVLDAPVNKGHLCVKGRYAHRFAHAPDRVLTPLIRTDDGWKAIGWAEAYEFIGNRLQQILDESGPSAVGVLGSARATNEDNYLAQKFSRVVLRSNNVDCCARVCHAPSAAALKSTLGTGAATNSFDDIEQAKAFIVCGANPTENHPIVGARIKQAVLKGARLVVIDPRQTELARFADVHLQIRPGTNVPVLHGVAHALIEQGLVDREFVQSRTDKFEEFWEMLQAWTPERAAQVAGVSADQIRLAAQNYGSHAPAMIFHGLGMTEHTQGTEGVQCLVNLALLTGNLGRIGSGENPLRGQNNVQGSAHMGCEPSNLAGYTPIDQAAEHVEAVWGVPVPRHQGLNWMKMVDAGAEGSLRALYAIGYDVYFSNPDAAKTAAGLENLELLIVQDMFLNETAKRFAHVFLPACSSYEKDGTFMNSERRVQRVRQCIPLVGDSKPDWLILTELAQKMGRGREFSYSSPEQIWQEVQAVWKAGAGISYDRIEQHGIQWPCLNLDHPGTTILHKDKFPHGGPAAFSLIEYVPTPEVTDKDFPFLLSTGRTLAQFNAGTMSQRTGNSTLRPTDVLEINPTDAEGLGVAEGGRVRMTSRYGWTEITVTLVPSMRIGELFTTFHDPNVFTNKITGPYRDRVVGSPEYKVTAVQLEAL